jgi:hypothetical protein
LPDVVTVYEPADGIASVTQPVLPVTPLDIVVDPDLIVTVVPDAPNVPPAQGLMRQKIVVHPEHTHAPEQPIFPSEKIPLSRFRAAVSRSRARARKRGGVKCLPVMINGVEPPDG